jgi:hypothetical protein
MNAFSWMGEKKDKAVDFIKKGFVKLFKTDYFGNLFKAINNLAKALTNSFMSWLKFFLMMAFIDPSGGFLRDIINLFVEIGMILFKTIMPLIPVAIKMMFDTIVYVFKLVLSLVPSIITTIMQTFTQLGDTFPILKPIIGFLNQFLGALRSLFLVFNDPKADKGNGIKRFLKKVFEILLDMVGKAVDFIAPYVPKVINAISDFIMQTLIPALIKYVPKILDVFSEGLDMIIKKYPNLKVWLQPFKDIFDMISAYIGSFAKFDSGAFVRENDEYKKLEKATMQSKEFTRATEEKRLKMLSDLQYGFMVDNKKMVKDAEAQFKKQTDDKLNLAKEKWSEFLTHIMESLGKAYDSLPDTAKYALWIYVFVKVIGVIATIIGFFSKLWTVLSFLAPVGTFLLGVLKTIGIAIAGFVGSLSAVTIGIVIAVLAIIGLVWYFWDDIKKFFSNMFNYVSEWWDKLKILEPLKNIGLMILGFLGMLAEGVYDEFIQPLIDTFDDLLGFIKNIELPSWLGGSSKKEEPSKQVNPMGNISQNTFEQLQQQRAEAERNYLKSSEFSKDMSLYKREEVKSMARVGTFDITSKAYQDSVKHSLEKTPLSIKPTITTTATEIQLPPIKAPAVDVKLDMKNANTSLTTFSDTVSQVFFALSRYVREKIGYLYGKSLTDLQKSSAFDKGDRSTEDYASRVKFFTLDERTGGALSELYKKSNYSPQDIRKALQEGGISDSSDDLVGSIFKLITQLKTPERYTERENQVVFNTVAKELATRKINL